MPQLATKLLRISSRWKTEVWLGEVARFQRFIPVLQVHSSVFIFSRRFAGVYESTSNDFNLSDAVPFGLPGVITWVSTCS
jgi:hypothetical protein